MMIVAQALVALVAALHGYFLVLEMFLWTTPTGRRTFGLDAEFAQRTKSMAANQGLYNGFLAAGLLWGLVTATTSVLVFFLSCVIVAGCFGALTVGNRILVAQALPGAVALLAVVLTR
jgi:putative membrane protein